MSVEPASVFRNLLLVSFALCFTAPVAAQSLDEAAVTRAARGYSAASGGAEINGISVKELRWAIDMQEIRSVLSRYTRGIDRHDVIMLASAFWPDAHIQYGDTFSGTRDKFARWAIADDSARFLAHTHNITNQNVQIDGSQATAESYLIGLEQRRDGKLQIVGGRYIDRLERRHGEWRIAHREYLIDARGIADNEGFTPGVTCHGACGRLDSGDLSYGNATSR